MKRPAVFIDRDGTINEQLGYINHESRFVIFPFVAEAVKLLNDNEFLAIVVTNQSGIGRGYYPEDLVLELHGRLRDKIAEIGARFDNIYYCPHHPHAELEAFREDCNCRKPRTGLIDLALKDFDIDMPRSYVVGDRYVDMDFAKRASLAGVLVKTGYGMGEIEYKSEGSPVPEYMAEDLLDAVKWILEREGRLEKNPPEYILIIKLSAIGDVIHTLPFLEAIRRQYPEAAIDWLIEEDASQIIEGHKELDRIMVSRRKSWQRAFLRSGKRMETLRAISGFVRKLRAREYDLVIDIQGLLKSGLMTGLVKGKRKVGFSGGREGSSIFLTERPFPVNYDQHALDRYLQAARHLGCKTHVWEGAIPVRQSDKESVNRLIQENGLQDKPLVAINPMAKWETKLWDSKKFSVLATRLQKELGCKIFFTGSGQDRPVLERIIGAMETQPFNLAGQTTLKELAYLFSKCDLAVTTDTGPMHLAAAMGCPVVALFGPTSPLRTGPYGEGHVVVWEELDCAPCFKKSCDHLSCMGNITVEKVFDAVSQVLTSKER